MTVGDRLDLADTEGSTTPQVTVAERAEFTAAFHFEDPRSILNQAIFLVLLLAAFQSRHPLRREGSGERWTTLPVHDLRGLVADGLNGVTTPFDSEEPLRKRRDRGGTRSPRRGGPDGGLP